MFLHGEDVGEDMVGEGLEVSVNRVECVGGEGGGDDPFVVGLVDVFVYEWVVFPSVDPVYAVIRKHQERWDRQEKPHPSMFINTVIQLGIPQNLSLKPRES